MPDLNPESLRAARGAYEETAVDMHAWDNSVCPPVLRTRLSYDPSAGIEAAIRAYLATDPLRSAIGDLLHMHRQGDVSAEMWERVETAFDGAKP